MAKTAALLTYLLCTIVSTAPLIAGELTPSSFLQVTAVIDTRTTYSDGVYDLASLARLARDRGIDALFLNDHDRLALEFGMPPFRNIFRKRVELNSINRKGAQNYLEDIRMAGLLFPEVILIPGSESAPFYYWEGSFLTGTLTAHDYEKRLLTIGMQLAKDYQRLPVIHNGLSTRHLYPFLPRTVFFLIACVLGFLLMKASGFYRISGILLSAICFLAILDTHPFRSSPFSQYDGNQGIAPYQLLIDYVNSKGGMTFWNYPETRSGIRRLGPVSVHTAPYPDVLAESRGYTGFAAVYGDGITATEPGNHWDRVLLDYCAGTRAHPVWGIAAADFHRDGAAGQKLGDFPTVLLVRRKTRADILAALKEGRMYASQTRHPQQILLREFTVSAADGSAATMGDEIVLEGNPRIRMSVALKHPVQNRVKIRLIRSGSVIETFSGQLPMEIDYEDRYGRPGQKIYYRMDLSGHGILVANPIFVEFQ